MKRRILIAGGGPAGLSLAYGLLVKHGFDTEVTILEKEEEVGGLASGFERESIHFDYGSHRLHPATPQEIQEDIRSLIGTDLLDRPRNGRIRILDTYVKFPLKPLDFVPRLPASFFLGIVGDTLAKPFAPKNEETDTFEKALLSGLGKTICTHFYFPYAEKLWGLPPSEISAVQAKRRVAASSIGKMILKVLSGIPGLRKKGTGRFFYPKKGFIEIFNGYADAIRSAGGEIRLGHEVSGIDPAKKLVKTSRGSIIPYDLFFSTIPITSFVRAIDGGAPQDVLAALENIKYQGMLFCYLVLDTSRFTPYDAHYFPEKGLVFSRLSEPKNYSDSALPALKTGLCFEIPCTVGGELWNLPENEVASLVIAHLEKAGLPVSALVKRSFVMRTPFAYPVYHRTFEEHLAVVNRYIGTLPGIVLLGRQALFVHDNTHHTIAMGYAAAECFSQDLSWNPEQWDHYLEAFKCHVVED
jgi:protoporphyrinogen oxidase